MFNENLTIFKKIIPSAAKGTGLPIGRTSLPVNAAPALPFSFQRPAGRAVAEPLFNKDFQIKLVDDIIFILV